MFSCGVKCEPSFVDPPQSDWARHILINAATTWIFIRKSFETPQSTHARRLEEHIVSMYKPTTSSQIHSD